MSFSQRLLCLVVVALSFSACDGDGGLAAAEQEGATMDLFVSSSTVGSIDDLVSIWATSGTTQDTCPTITTGLEVDGTPLTVEQKSGWVAPPPICLSFSGACSSGCQTGSWIADQLQPTDTEGTTVTVGSGAHQWTMTAQHANATRKLTLSSGPTAHRGDVVVINTSPLTDDFANGNGGDIFFGAPSDGGEPGFDPTTPTGTGATYEPGTVSFTVPTGLKPGTYALQFGFSLQPHVSVCDGPASCTAFNDNPFAICGADGGCSVQEMLLTVQ